MKKVLSYVSKLIKYSIPYGLVKLYDRYIYRIDPIIKKIFIKYKKNNFGITQDERLQDCVVLCNGPSLKKEFDNSKFIDLVKNKVNLCK